VRKSLRQEILGQKRELTEWMKRIEKEEEKELTEWMKKMKKKIEKEDEDEQKKSKIWRFWQRCEHEKKLRTSPFSFSSFFDDQTQKMRSYRRTCGGGDGGGGGNMSGVSDVSDVDVRKRWWWYNVEKENKWIPRVRIWFGNTTFLLEKVPSKWTISQILKEVGETITEMPEEEVTDNFRADLEHTVEIFGFLIPPEQQKIINLEDLIWRCSALSGMGPEVQDSVFKTTRRLQSYDNMFTSDDWHMNPLTKKEIVLHIQKNAAENDDEEEEEEMMMMSRCRCAQEGYSYCQCSDDDDDDQMICD